MAGSVSTRRGRAAHARLGCLVARRLLVATSANWWSRPGVVAPDRPVRAPYLRHADGYPASPGGGMEPPNSRSTTTAKVSTVRTSWQGPMICAPIGNGLSPRSLGTTGPGRPALVTGPALDNGAVDAPGSRSPFFGPPQRSLVPNLACSGRLRILSPATSATACHGLHLPPR
jgi:hypothetical protein